MTKPRGRPISYIPECVLKSALYTFWKNGYMGTSLDVLAEATGLNRPSLYNGFGDKCTIYLKAMRYFKEYVKQRIAVALQQQPTDRSFTDVITRYLDTVIEIYDPQTNNEVRGCAIISTATAEGLTHAGIQTLLNEVLDEMDNQILTRLTQAQHSGEIPNDTDTNALCFLLTSITHSIGIRSRAGQSKEELKKMVNSLPAFLLSV